MPIASWARSCPSRSASADVTRAEGFVAIARALRPPRPGRRCVQHLEAEQPDEPARRGELSIDEAPLEMAEVLELCRLARGASAGSFDPWKMPGGLDPTGLVKGWAGPRGASACWPTPASGRRWSTPAETWPASVSRSRASRGTSACATRSPPAGSRASSSRRARSRPQAATSAARTSSTPEAGSPRRGCASATVAGPQLWLADALATGLLRRRGGGPGLGRGPGRLRGLCHRVLRVGVEHRRLPDRPLTGASAARARRGLGPRGRPSPRGGPRLDLVRLTALVFVRASLYVSLGLVFGILAFVRSNAYKRRTGNSPWHIHPLVWGGVSVFVAFLVTLLSIVFVAIFGTLLSIVAWSPRLSPGRHRDVAGVSEYDEGGLYESPELGASPGAAKTRTPTALTAWLPDPTGRNELRYFDGSGWTEHVANTGVISTDTEIPPA